MAALFMAKGTTSSTTLNFLLILSSCLLATSVINNNLVAADSPLTREQLYAQYGFVNNWVAPMPNNSIAAAGANSTQPGLDTGAGYILHNWSTNYKTINVGANDISFIEDPYSAAPAPSAISGNGNNNKNNSSNQVMQINYPKGSYAPKEGPVPGGTSFYAKPFGDDTPYEKMMISYDVAFPVGFDWVLVYAYIPATDNSNFCKDPNVLCNDQFGKSIGRGAIYFAPGTWTRVDMAMQLNEPAGRSNGILDVYINGLKVISMDSVPYRSTGMVGFQGLMFSTFFGGNTAQYATPVDTSVLFRNIQLSVGNPAVLYEGSAGGKIIGSRGAIQTMMVSAIVALLVLILA
ncbi:hypothetical protein FBU30_008344 [Linnemannia zychae]|nr:hypothetical protein FBU30_008344 [Linnemannia zychae]